MVLAALIRGLRASGIPVSPGDETEAAQFTAAFLGSNADAAPDREAFFERLKPYLRALLAKSTEEAAKFEAIYAAASSILSPPPPPPPPPDPNGSGSRAARRWAAIAVAIYCLALGFAIYKLVTPATETGRPLQAPGENPQKETPSPAAQPKPPDNQDRATAGGANLDAAALRVVRAFGAGTKANLWEIASRLGESGGITGPAIFTHDSAVDNALFSPDGRRIVTASEDKVAVWDATTGQLLFTLKAQEGSVSDAGFSPDGARIVTGSSDRTARVWDAKSGQLFLTLQGHSAGVSSAAFSPDGTRIVTGSPDTTARVWDAKSGQLLLTLQGRNGEVHGAAYSLDGARIVTASRYNAAQVWDAKSGQLLLSLRGHDDGITKAAFSPDGARIVTASWDKTARVWDANTGKPLGEPLKGHERYLNSAAFSPDGRRIVTASMDKTARLWDAETGAPVLFNSRTPQTAAEMFKLLLRDTGFPPKRQLDGGDIATLRRITKSLLMIEQPDEAPSDKMFDDALARAQKVTAPPQAPKVEPFSASSAVVTPWWLFGLIAGLPLVLLLRRVLRFSKRKRAYLRQLLESDGPAAVYRLAVTEDAAAAIASLRRDLRAAARFLIRRTAVPSEDLDAEATALASAANVGRFAPMFATRRVTPDTLLLITLGSALDSEGERLSWLAREIERMSGAPGAIERWYIERGGDRVFQRLGDPHIGLDALAGRFPQHRLILLGTGDGFLAPGDLEPWPWAATLRRWDMRAFATPLPPETWGLREARLAKLFERAPYVATSAGLRRLGADLALERRRHRGLMEARAPGWRSDPLRWTMQVPPDKERAWEAISAELGRFLDPSAREWLCACAVYPGLRWDITLYLGLKLKNDGGQPLFSEDRAARLCQLPWFRLGMMPDWVRAPLIAELSPARRKEVIAFLGDLYGRASLADEIKRRPGQTVINLPVAVAGGGAALDARTDLGAAASDALFLDVAQKEDPAAFEAPPNLGRRLSGGRRGGQDNFLRHEWRSLSVFALYAATAIWLVPKPWEGPWLTGAWLPLAVLAITGGVAWAIHAGLSAETRQGRDAR
jgi:hypothetical protein